MKKYICNYECKFYFGQLPITANSQLEARQNAKIIIMANHKNLSKEVIEGCGKCKLKIKL